MRPAAPDLPQQLETIHSGHVDVGEDEDELGANAFAELTQQPEIQHLIGQEVDRVNRTVSQVESIKKFALLPRRFYEEEGDVTPTKKVKRRNLERRYADLIESLYGGR